MTLDAAAEVARSSAAATERWGLKVPGPTMTTTVRPPRGGGIARLAGIVCSSNNRLRGASVVTESLDPAVDAREIVAALRYFGITRADIATATGISRCAVLNRRTGDIHPDRYNQLTQLRDVVRLLSDSPTPRGVGQWMHAKHRLLSGQRPIDLIPEAYAEVLGAAEAFVDGTYV